jgi:phage baseplate assembly protein W
MTDTRQVDVINPHFKVPFNFGGLNGGAFVNDQDSFEDLHDCMLAIVAFPVGSRQELPEFGSPDMSFNRDPGVVPTQLKTAISQWEPRPNATVDGQQIITDDMIVSAMAHTRMP